MAPKTRINYALLLSDTDDETPQAGPSRSRTMVPLKRHRRQSSDGDGMGGITGPTILKMKDANTEGSADAPRAAPAAMVAGAESAGKEAKGKGKERAKEAATGASFGAGKSVKLAGQGTRHDTKKKMKLEDEVKAEVQEDEDEELGTGKTGESLVEGQVDLDRVPTLATAMTALHRAEQHLLAYLKEGGRVQDWRCARAEQRVSDMSMQLELLRLKYEQPSRYSLIREHVIAGLQGLKLDGGAVGVANQVYHEDPELEVEDADAIVDSGSEEIDGASETDQDGGRRWTGDAEEAGGSGGADASGGSVEMSGWARMGTSSADAIEIGSDDE